MQAACRNRLAQRIQPLINRKFQQHYHTLAENMVRPKRSAIFGLAAVLSSPRAAWSWSSPSQHYGTKSSFLTRTNQLNTAQYATIAPEGETYSAPSSDENSSLDSDLVAMDGTVVAEGVVVARFAGGLTAVRVLDDFTMSSTEQKSGDNLIPANLPASLTRTSAATGDDLQGRIVVFPNEAKGFVVAHRPPVLFVHTSLQETTENEEKNEVDGSVKILSSRMHVKVPQRLLNGLATMDSSIRSNAVFSPIPQIKDIALINNPVLTGITAFDALAPIGRGQNMIFVGHDIDSMRQYTVDFLTNQLKNNPNITCVYAAIDDADKVNNLLEKHGIQDAVHVVAPVGKMSEVDEMSASAEAVATAAKSCAIAENLALKEGRHTIVVVDTIDFHKKLWDGTTRVLVDVFGVDAVVRGDREGGASSEMRAFFSNLVQRAAQFKIKRGGGSLTLLMLTKIPRMGEAASTVFQESDFVSSSDKVKDRIKLLTKRNIPLTAENLRKVDIPIPSVSEGQRRLALQHVDDLISMSDGQIWFDEKLEAAGRSPPMDPQRSVTRVGIGADTESRADAPALRRIVEGLRLILSQAANMDGAEANSASKKQVLRQRAFLLAMHQESGTGGRTLSESCSALLAASGGHLDKHVNEGALAGTEQGREIITGLLLHLKSTVPDIMSEMDETLDLTDEHKELLSEAIKTYMEI